jgi:hypothetical protein
MVLKLDDITDSNIHMLYHILNTTQGRRLFEKMNIKATEIEKEETKDSKGKIIKCYYYSAKIKNYYNADSKKLLQNDKFIKDAKRVIIERKNKRIVSDYFKKMSKKNKK